MILNSFKKTASKNPNIVRLSNDTLGSKNMRKIESSSIILTNDKYLNYYDDFINFENKRFAF